MSSTLSVSQETTTDADDVPDAQATDRTPDEQLVINATEELSRRGFPSSEQQLESRVKELGKGTGNNTKILLTNFRFAKLQHPDILTDG